MKLELKHLAPYLPYGLKINECIIGKNLKMIGVEHTHELRIRLTDGLYSCSGNNLKPILRPLSDLRKHNDEVEINEHYINNALSEKEFGNEYGVFSYFNNEIEIELESDPELRYDSSKSISFKSIQKINDLLYQGHYDVFGLIPQGLAIDINTLNK